jgi:6-phosphogluconate dehydrogenase
MQLISEVYEIMLEGLGMTHDEMANVFESWNKGDLDSYLIEITRDILRYKDSDGKPLVTKILDSAGQKGTGKWTAIDSLDRGIPVTLIGEAVYSRCLSSLKEERVRASSILAGPKNVKFQGKCDAKERNMHTYKRSIFFSLPEKVTRSNSWITWVKLCMPPRLCRTPKVICSCVKLPKTMGGI